MCPPSSQQSSRSGVGVEVAVAVAAGVRVAVGIGGRVGDGELVEVAVGLLVAVGVSEIDGLNSAGGSTAQAVTSVKMDSMNMSNE